MEKTNDKRKPNQGGKSVFAGIAGGKTPTKKLHIAKPNKIDPNLTAGEEKPPKVEQKSYKDLTAKSVIKLPHNQVRPVNGRIFVITVDPTEMKTEGGIILPSSYQKETAKGSQKRTLLRYFVIDVADDCTIRFTKTENSSPSKIERGDEVFPFIPVEAVDFEFPELHDFYNNENYTVIHETELGGVGVSSLIEKEEK